MGTSRDDIKGWFESGKKENATHMIVVCDEFDYDDYPVYAHDDTECLEQFDKFNGKNMQRVMEVYDLRMDMKEQLDERRARHLPIKG
jgi:hypothetical protein